MLDRLCYKQNEYIELKANMYDYLQKDIVTCNRGMIDQIERIDKILNTDVTVLINGETGTGKEIFAEYIHKNSYRKKERYVKLNCSTIPETLFESEMFGYSAGAFTGASKTGKKGVFELANKGTLFLDEIGDMPFDMQSKLLRILEENRFIRVGGDKEICVNVRFIAATNKDLNKMIKEKGFREDLYYRINVIPINLTPLKNRPEDIILLSFYFLKESNHKYNYNKRWSEDALRTFLDYNWPGNIRELKNVIERLVLLTVGDIISNIDIAIESIEDKKNTKFIPEKLIDIIENPWDDGRALKEIIADYEINIIKNSIKTSGSLRKAAKLLKSSPSTLSRKLSLYRKNK